METISISKKITTNTLGFSKIALQELVKAAKGKEVDILSVLAFVTGYKEHPNKFNAQNTDVRFQGNFEMTNLHSGEVQRASEAYFPGSASAWVKAAFDAAHQSANEAEGQKTPAMAFVITVKEDKKENSATGYTFGCKGLVEEKKADLFAELRKALPKPKAK